jgi:hypothetical protein
MGSAVQLVIHPFGHHRCVICGFVVRFERSGVGLSPVPLRLERRRNTFIVKELVVGLAY